jgi:formate-dependent nitrite reductase membrane component NrfD
VAAVGLILTGAVLTVFGVCGASPTLFLVGTSMAGVGVALFAFWAFLCASTTPCHVMQSAHCLLYWLVITDLFITALIAFVGAQQACIIASAATWGGFGTMYAWLGSIMTGVNCPKRCG